MKCNKCKEKCEVCGKEIDPLSNGLPKSIYTPGTNVAKGITRDFKNYLT